MAQSTRMAFLEVTGEGDWAKMDLFKINNNKIGDKVIMFGCTGNKGGKRGSDIHDFSAMNLKPKSYITIFSWLATRGL